MLSLDSSAVLIMFSMIQWIPYIVMELSGFKYLMLMRKANTQSIRKAELQPRKLLNYISRFNLMLLLSSHIGFVLLVEYFRSHPFDGFGGYHNLIILLLMDALFYVVLMWHLRGKSLNPYASSSDRIRHLQKMTKTMTLTIVLVVLFAAVNIILSATETRHLLDILPSLYFIVLGFITLQNYRVDCIDFAVYKEK